MSRQRRALVGSWAMQRKQDDMSTMSFCFRAAPSTKETPQQTADQRTTQPTTLPKKPTNYSASVRRKHPRSVHDRKHRSVFATLQGHRRRRERHVSVAARRQRHSGGNCGAKRYDELSGVTVGGDLIRRAAVKRHRLEVGCKCPHSVRRPARQGATAEHEAASVRSRLSGRGTHAVLILRGRTCRRRA